MESIMRVSKWGNSLAIRIPKDVAEALGLKEGDEIEVSAAEPRGVGISRKRSREELLKSLRSFRGLLPADYKFDREEANAR
jgi:antitoxin MazE